ncbi:MAG: hypothetical protein ABIT96_08135 [Ferruginibacter sp.]
MHFIKPEFYVLLVIFFAQGCVNKDDPYAAQANANLVFRGLNYSSGTNNTAGGNVHFTNGTTQGVWARFATLPNGSVSTFKIVRGPASLLANDEMVFQVDFGDTDNWYSTGADNKITTVSKDYYGDVTVTVPPVSVQRFLNGVMQSDSTTASATLFYRKP